MRYEQGLWVPKEGERKRFAGTGNMMLHFESFNWQNKG